MNKIRIWMKNIFEQFLYMNIIWIWTIWKISNLNKFQILTKDETNFEFQIFWIRIQFKSEQKLKTRKPPKTPKPKKPKTRKATRLLNGPAK
jgi:hypothetical protein